MENKLFDLAAKRRSVRRYTSEHIPDEVLNEIMKVALTAPCSFGHRPVEFVIVRDKIRELAECKSLGGSQIIGADAVIVNDGVEDVDMQIDKVLTLFGIEY